jgi:hypothetical protein
MNGSCGEADLLSDILGADNFWQVSQRLTSEIGD